MRHEAQREAQAARAMVADAPKRTKGLERGRSMVRLARRRATEGSAAARPNYQL
jgi:hypothetical protein